MEWGIQLEVLGTVALAMLLGGVVGFEREVADKPAGLRTLMLVSGGAALFVALGDAVLENYFRPDSPVSVGGARDMIRSDPIRIIEAIVTGVSFLGAGTIIRGTGRDDVQGLTTAASILLAAALGVTVALHQLVLAAGVTVLALIALRALRLFERKALKKG
jgi:putative Mg2+ transporter-C (MgtC) family protein